MEKKHFILLDFKGQLVGIGQVLFDTNLVRLSWTAEKGDGQFQYDSILAMLREIKEATIFSWTNGKILEGAHTGNLSGLFRDTVLFRGWQGLTRAEAAIWGRLWRAKGEWVSNDSLHALLEMHAIAPGSLRTHLKNIRKKLAPKGIIIENTIKDGYRVAQKED